MLEVVAGTLLLLLGWMCFGQVSRVRAGHTMRPAPHPRPYTEKPATFITMTLGLLSTLCGLALLALAGCERLRAAVGLDFF